MATNKGDGGRKGAVKNRYQLLNPNTGLWSVFSRSGGHLRTKKSPGRAKGIRVGPPKRS